MACLDMFGDCFSARAREDSRILVFLVEHELLEDAGGNCAEKDRESSSENNTYRSPNRLVH